MNARRKALADRKAAMAAEGLTPVDDKDNDPRTMTFTSADGTKTVEYTLNDGIGFGGWACSEAPLRCNYVPNELITERTAHKVGDTIEYEFATREETNHYYMTYDFRNGFSPVTLEGSLENAASIASASSAAVVPAFDPGNNGKEDPTVKEATQILLDAVKESKDKTLEEAIRIILRGKRQGKELLKKEIEKIWGQKIQRLYAGDMAWELSERLMHLGGALKAIDDLAKQALYDKGYQDAQAWLRDHNRGPLPSQDLDPDYTEGFKKAISDHVELLAREGYRSGGMKDDLGDLALFLAIFAGVSGLAGAAAAAAYEALYSAYLATGVAFYNLAQRAGSVWQRIWNLLSGGGAAAEGRAGAAVEIEAAAAQANKLHHIFGKADHALDGLVEQFGSQQKAFEAVQNAANRALQNGQLTPNAEGILPTGNAGNIIDVAGTQVRLIGGYVQNGVVRISSFSREGL